MKVELIIFIAELIGVAAFAITGVYAAIERKLDFIGAVVLGCLTACGGGLLRDIMIGQIPPMLFRAPVYVTVAAGVSLLAFAVAYFAGGHFRRHRQLYDGIINIFDAVGLAVFVIVGVNVAAQVGYGDSAFVSLSVGVLTGVGGGIIRDTMSGSVPVILRKRIYALAAIAGAVAYYYLGRAGLAQWASMAIGAGLVVLIRILATLFKWNLPRIKEFTE